MQTDIIDQLEDIFIENKNSHRSPIINLPEILMFKYDKDDLIKCGENFRECQVAKDDDPVNNTVKFYTDKYQHVFSQPALNKILEIIINNKYAIFHYSKDEIFLVCVDPEQAEYSNIFCIDKIIPRLASSKVDADNKELSSDKVEALWKSENPPYSFNELSQYVYELIHKKGYEINKDILALANYNEDYMDNLKIRPAFEAGYFDLVTEANQQAPATIDIAGNVDAFLNDSKLATADSLVGDRLDVSKSNRTAPPPEDDPNNPQQQQQDQSQEGDPNQQPQQDGEEQDPNQQGDEEQPQEGDDQNQEDGQDPNQQGDDGQQQGDQQQQQEEPPSPGEELLNDPETKPKYRLKFVVLYKNVSDIIDTLESFTPEYNSAFISKYYQVQSNLVRLKEAIFKICTGRINKMDNDDVMKAYASANITYDALSKMLAEFMDEYSREREKLTGKRQEIKDKIQEKSFISARK